jgi:hypothetical protein
LGGSIVEIDLGLLEVAKHGAGALAPDDVQAAGKTTEQ